MKLSWKVASFGLLLGLSLVAQGQDDPAAFKKLPSGDVIEGWLDSGDAREMAWAAVFALEERDTSFVPAFVSLAEQWRPLPRGKVLEGGYRGAPELTLEERERRDAMSAVLDAVIQMKASVPAASLHFLAGDFPAQSIVLLARMPWQEAQSTLLAVYGEPAPASRYVQRAAASLLALHPPPGFAGSLLSNITVTAHVFVSLPEDPSMGMGRSSGDCGASPFTPIKTTWPAIGKYFWREGGAGKNPESTLTIPGLRPIDVVRVVMPVQLDPGECSTFAVLNNAMRVTLLAEMLGVLPEHMAIQSHDDVNLKVVNIQDYRGQLAAYVNREEGLFRKVKMDLVGKQLLSAAEAGDDAVLPGLRLVVEDIRTVKDFPVEEVRFLYPKVEWGDLHGFYE